MVLMKHQVGPGGKRLEMGRTEVFVSGRYRRSGSSKEAEWRNMKVPALSYET